MSSLFKVYIVPLIIISQILGMEFVFGDINYDLKANYEHGFDTDIDGGGQFGFNRYSVNGSIGKYLNDKTNIELNLNYGFTDFDFSGDDGFGELNPWDGVNRVGTGFRIQYTVNPKWGLSSGLFIKYSGEQGAEFDDSLTYGGLAGFTYMPNRDLLIGSGIFISSRIEDDVILYPGLIINWMLNDRLRLSTILTSVKSELGPGINLNYNLGSRFDASIAVGYEFQRFRLDDGNVSPNGVGDLKLLPIWGSISYSVNKSLSIELYSGIAFLGEMELEDSDGRRILKRDFDNMIFIGTGFKLNL